MSLEITFENDDERADYNISHHFAVLADVVGLYKPLWHPESLGIVTADDLLPHLVEGCKRIYFSDKVRWRVFDLDSKWCTLEGLIKFLHKLLIQCVITPDAKITVKREIGYENIC